MIKCAFCKFASPYIDREAEFVIDGQAVCEDHVDAPTEEPFSRALYRVQQEAEARG